MPSFRKLGCDNIQWHWHTHGCIGRIGRWTFGVVVVEDGRLTFLLAKQPTKTAETFFWA